MKKRKIETKGDYSPGHVVGDYILNQNPIINQSISKAEVSNIISSYNHKIKEVNSRISVLGKTQGAVELNHIYNIESGYIPFEVAEVNVELDSGKITSIIDFFSFLTSNKRILISGLPGSGKTTLLKYLSYFKSSSFIRDSTDNYPVLVSLKKFNKTNSTIEQFIKNSINARCDSIQDFEVLIDKNILFESSTIVLFDGVDEIEDKSTYNNISKILDKFALTYPRCVIIIVSRPIAIRDQSFSKYKRCEILPLSNTGVDDYISNWFSSDKTNASQLQIVIEQNIRIKKLSFNPFLLSMICYTFQTCGQEALMEGRSQLYESCIHFLIQRLYDDSYSNQKEISSGTILDLLKEISLKFFLWQESDFNIEHLNLIGQGVLKNEKSELIVEIFNEIEKETGLIIQFDEGFSFVHKSLWEYFTALALLNKDLSEIIKHSANPDWEEVIRLYAGMLESSNSIEILLTGLWNINRPLALRTLSELKSKGVGIIKKLLNTGDVNKNSSQLIDSLRQSLPLISKEERLAFVDETIEILFFDCQIKDCEVIYKSQILLEELNMKPLELGGLIYKLLDLDKCRDRQLNYRQDKMNYFEWIEVKGGQFLMGSDDENENAKPAHQVEVSDFKMSKHPITYKLALDFPFYSTKEKPYSLNLPAVNITWYEAFYFALWIGARLPFEAEWEYAARGGSFNNGNRYYFGNSKNDLDKNAWYNDYTRRIPHEITEINPFTKSENLNQLGLANMLGNIWEWCYDFYESYKVLYNEESPLNPIGSKISEYRVVRGGSYRNKSESLFCSSRDDDFPYSRYFDGGFRVVSNDD